MSTADDQSLAIIDEIREEQGFFDYAVAERLRAAAWVDPNNWSGATAADRRGFQRIRDSKTNFNDSDPIAHGSITLESGETYHVGKLPIFNEDREALVVSWQSPMGAKYYQATYADPQDLVAKRAIDAPFNIVESISDTIFAEIAANVAELRGELKPDDVLLASLESSRDGSMSEIASTIQAAQDRIIRADKDQLLIVQGGPGTGKTAVALHRVSWLLYNFPDELTAADILVVGPNPTFTRYIRQVLPSLGDENVVQKSLNELLAPGTTVAGVDDDRTATLKGSAMMLDLLSNALDARIRNPESPVSLRLRNSGRTVALDAEKIVSRLKQLRSEYYVVGRAKLRDYLIELATPQLSVAGGVSAGDLLDAKSLDAATERIWPQLSAPQFLRDLFGSKDRLLRAAPKQFLATHIEALYRSSADRVSDEKWTMADLALLDECNELMRGEVQTFTHIVVDEAQDLSEMQLMAIRRRSRGGAMTIVGDIAQSTGPHASDNWDVVKAGLQSNQPVNEVVLEHGYRVPREAFDVALPVLKVAAPSVTPPKIVRDSNVEPTFTTLAEEDFYTGLVARIRDHAASGRSVGVIATHDQWIDIKSELHATGSKWGESTSGQLSSAINLVTPADAKGLEFDAVMVVDPSRILRMPRGARFLYIALTRTTTYLDVVCPEGQVPNLLAPWFGGGEGRGDGDGAEALTYEENSVAPAASEPDYPTAREPVAETTAPTTDQRGAVMTSGGNLPYKAKLTPLSDVARRGVESNAGILLEELMELAPKKTWAHVVEELGRLISSQE